MKRKMIYIVAFLLLSIIIYVYCFKNQTFYINLTWKISLPYCDNLIYQREDIGFRGEGERYLILKFKQSLGKKIKWEKQISKEDKKTIISILNEKLKISKDNLPPFDANTLYNISVQADNSKLFLLYEKGTRKLYVIEMIM